jgi:predicted nuclease of predicted toxin-antitoxin system
LSNNLKILLDEAVTTPLAALIRQFSGLSVECVRELSIKGSDDQTVVRYASDKRRIVVTTESGMHDKAFPPCTHSGIIVLAGSSRHETTQAEIFRRFLLSGRRTEAKDAVTFLTEREVRIKDHSGSRSFHLP